MWTRYKWLPFLLTLGLLVTACSPTVPDTAANKPTDERLLTAEWNEVVQLAKGQTVNWYMWGGSDAINVFVDEQYGKMLKETYDITLNRVPVADTAEAVNKVLNEKQAGKTSGGNVDLIWINGENFATLKQANALYGPWATRLPNAQYVDGNNPAVANDFGVPTEGYESVWGSAQFQFVYDSTRISEADVPKNYAELQAWVKQHPGRFTYNAPPDFIGTRFVKQLLYEVTGGYEQWQKPLDKAEFEEKSQPAWDYLTDIKPHLWRKGETYPKTIAELITLFHNGEVDFAFIQDIGGVGTDIARGRFPQTARPYVFDTGTIGDYHYVAIPYHAASKAAALVVANLILDPTLQIAKANPEQGWGDGIGIDPTKLTGAERTAYEELQQSLGELAVPAERLKQTKLPDMPVAYTSVIEESWRQHVLYQK